MAFIQPAKAGTESKQALQWLVEGNTRFAENHSTDLNESAERRTEVSKGQKPFAVILSCVDSRVPPELIFDRGLGDLLVVRTAGQVLDSAVLGSLEFGVAEMGIPLLMVLGHERCGAVHATLDAEEHGTHVEGNIQTLIEGIRPAVEEAKKQTGDLLDNAVTANVLHVLNALKQSPILSKALTQGTLQIVGARYDLDTGKVEILPQNGEPELRNPEKIQMRDKR